MQTNSTFPSFCFYLAAVLVAYLVQVHVAVSVDLLPHHLLRALLTEVSVGPEPVGDGRQLIGVVESVEQEQRVVGSLGRCVRGAGERWRMEVVGGGTLGGGRGARRSALAPRSPCAKSRTRSAHPYLTPPGSSHPLHPQRAGAGARRGARGCCCRPLSERRSA